MIARGARTPTEFDVRRAPSPCPAAGRRPRAPARSRGWHSRAAELTMVRVAVSNRRHANSSVPAADRLDAVFPGAMMAYVDPNEAFGSNGGFRAPEGAGKPID